MHRRALLAGVGASLSVGAGCVGPGPNDTGRPTPSDTETPTPSATPTPDSSVTEPSGYIRPADDPKTVPQPLTCESASFERQNRLDDATQWGNAGQFALRIDSLTYDYGETARITLTNIGATTAGTGTRVKHRFEADTDAGWQPVGGSTTGDPLLYTDLGRSHEPGETLEWAIELTESGLREPQPDGYGVCPALQTGRYRFVFFGAEDHLAVAFDLDRR